MSLDALRVKVEDICCTECGTNFTPSIAQRSNRASDNAGPFCSRRCTGIYGARVQNTGQTEERTLVKKEYYRVEK
jgi:hypothetical protein